jgi:type 1 glutamine amidotransferase
MSRRATIFSGGHGHPFTETSAAMVEILAGRGYLSHTDIDFGACVKRLGDTDLLVVNALRWTMTQHEKYAPFRATLAYRPEPGQMDSLKRWVETGGGMLALHTAVICFDTEPGWLDMLGGGWRWGVSHHPPRGHLWIEPAGAPAFDLVDEAYHHMAPAADVTVRATYTLDEGPQPVAWTRDWGSGRVAVDTLGHDRSSIENPGHASLITGLLDWLAAG